MSNNCNGLDLSWSFLARGGKVRLWGCGHLSKLRNCFSVRWARLS